MTTEGDYVKKNTKKLVLNRETLRRIEDGALEGAGAGTTTAFGPTVCVPCQTNERACMTS